MTIDPKIALRLQFLVRVVRKECQHLATTDQRLFGDSFTMERAGQLETDLDRAERLGLIVSADEWMTMRKLRNQMVHEYVEDLAVLASALQTGHDFVSVLTNAANNLIAEIEQRNWG
jgi:hypothetical protein